jgi:hypothetical protein
MKRGLAALADYSLQLLATMFAFASGLQDYLGARWATLSGLKINRLRIIARW